MRFALRTGEEVEVREGTTVEQCREDLVALTGHQRWGTARLTVAGQVLTEEHVAGLRPWVQATVLDTGRSDPDPWTRAAGSLWHCAVVAGPDAGAVAVPSRDGRVVIGRDADGGAAGSGAPAVGVLTVTDPAASRRHAVVSLRGRRWGRRDAWLVTDEGSANGTTVVRPARPGRRHRPGRRLRPVQVPVGARASDRWARPRVVRPGDRIRLGGTTVVVRTGPQGDGTGAPQPGTDVVPGAAAADEPADGGPGVPVSAWLLPAVASLALAATMRNPVFLILMLAGPLGLALPAALRAMRRRRRRTAPPDDRSPALAPDPAWVSVALAAGATVGGPGPGPAEATSVVPWLALAADGFAVVGPRRAALSTARALLGAALLDPDLRLCLLHPASTDGDWAWARWLPARVGEPGAPWVAGDPDDAHRLLTAGRDRGHLVVADGSRWAAPLTAWRKDGGAPGGRLLLLAQDETLVPPWCVWVLRVDPDGAAQLVRRAEAGRPPRALAPLTASAGWLEAHARQVGQRDLPSAGASRTRLPDRVALVDCGVPGDTAAVLAAWAGDGAAGGRGSGLVATVGVSGDGAPVRVDLTGDGPHMLVAGTTGSGKSELLQSLVLGLALTRPPTAVAFVLVDHKGGASFGRCRALPHVIGQVTDLDPVEAGRALDGVRAEVRTRERLLAAAGVTSLDELIARRQDPLDGVPPRLVVVVDEFRAFTEDLPDFVPGLVRVAAQGRSLGIHLVLATQRPAGAVSAQLRANLALRLCLRVTDAADSTDVVEVPDASTLPAALPGRAVLRRGPAPVELIQTAWAALGPAPWTSASGNASGARRAPPWSAAGPVRGGAEQQVDHTEPLVRVVQEAVEVARVPPPRHVWLPQLPTRISAAELAALDVGAAVVPSAGPGPDAERGIAVALGDRPADQAREVVRWTGDHPLVVAGRAGSGRTTALRVTVQGALCHGWHVHTVAGAEGLLSDADRDHPCVGTVVGPDDARGLARLLVLLAATERPVGHRALLAVDDVGQVVRALDQLPRGVGADLLERLLRGSGRRRLSVVLAGTPTDLVRLVPHAGERLVLGVADPHDDVLLGVPRTLAGGRSTPGRAVHLGPGGSDGHDGQPAATVRAVRCQVAVPGTTARDSTSGAERPPAGPPLRLRPVPRCVLRPAPKASGPETPGPGTRLLAGLGVGGDHAEPVVMDLSSGALVVGPPRSGRSEALSTLALALRADGVRIAVIARDGPLAAVGRGDPSRHATTPVQAAALLAAGPVDVVLVDDVDLLTRADPALDDLLSSWVAAAEAGDPSVPRVAASARTDRAASAYRGVVAALRGAAPVLVLTPSAVGSSDVAGTDLALAVDPSRPAHPGAGVLVDRAGTTWVQVAGPPVEDL